MSICAFFVLAETTFRLIDIIKKDNMETNIRLLQGDCIIEMDKIPDKSIDMILCDLPYGVTNNKADIVIPFEPLWKQYNRIIKDNGAILLFAQGIFYVDLVCSNRKMFRYDLIWDKVLLSGFLNAKRMPLRQHEQIAVFYKKPPIYNPQFREGKPVHSRGKKYLTKEVTNNNYGHFNPIEDNTKGNTQKYPTSIMTFCKPHPSKALHRTEKSVELLENLIKQYTNEGDLVLDSCMGCGSTGVACVNTKRRFIGIELDSTYYDVSIKRIERSGGKFEL